MSYKEQHPLRPSKQKPFTKGVIGFDVETVGDDNEFYMCSFVGADFNAVFYDKQAAIDFLRFDKRIKNGDVIVATNLHFDFFALLHDAEVLKEFRMLWRGSHLLAASTRRAKNGFDRSTKKPLLRFVDTMNYAGLSVEKLGKLIGVPKRDKPACLGRLPVSEDERLELEAYNVQDARVSREGLLFLYDAFAKLGATPQMTLASTAISLFKNRFLDDEVPAESTDEIREQMHAYYGGRVECFERGTLTGDFKLYDYNSLYPTAMLEAYPDVATKRVRFNDKAYPLIFLHEGYAHVDVHVPTMRYPPLPHRHEGRLCFPCGSFSGWWTHIELREAIKRGCRITKVHKVVYYKGVCYPYKRYVETLYAERLRYQREGSSMEYVCKILMNALYGKFAQRFDNRDNIEPFNHTAEQLDRFSWYEITSCGRYVRTKRSVAPAPFCKPVWAAYTTARARIRLLEGLEVSNAVYCDTDSLLTTRDLPTSNALGGLKQEFSAHTCLVVRAKMYALTGFKGAQKVRAKGLGKKMRVRDFIGVIEEGRVDFVRFTKLKEALRRKLVVNGKQTVEKLLSLEDTKRDWGDEPFDQNAAQDSVALVLSEELAAREA